MEPMKDNISEHTDKYMEHYFVVDYLVVDCIEYGYNNDTGDKMLNFSVALRNIADDFDAEMRRKRKTLLPILSLIKLFWCVVLIRGLYHSI